MTTPGGYPEQERQAARERDSRRSAEAKVAAAAAEARVAELLSRTPNPDDYEIVKHEPVGPHMAATDVMYWRRIDPHFSESDPADRRTAPAPRARYPADDQGWDDAVGFARSKAALPVGDLGRESRAGQRAKSAPGRRKAAARRRTKPSRA